MTAYAKAISCFLGTISTWGVTAAPDGIQAVEWWGLLGVIASTFAVYAYPNREP